jgi:hypothetical protein
MNSYSVEIKGRSDERLVPAEGYREENEKYVFFNTEGDTVFETTKSEVQSIRKLGGGDGRRVYVPPRPGGPTRGW